MQFLADLQRRMIKQNFTPLSSFESVEAMQAFGADKELTETPAGRLVYRERCYDPNTGQASTNYPDAFRDC